MSFWLSYLIVGELFALLHLCLPSLEKYRSEPAYAHYCGVAAMIAFWPIWFVTLLYFMFETEVSEE